MERTPIIETKMQWPHVLKEDPLFDDVEQRLLQKKGMIDQIQGLLRGSLSSKKSKVVAVR